MEEQKSTFDPSRFVEIEKYADKSKECHRLKEEVFSL